jgi:hypothetical protein
VSIFRRYVDEHGDFRVERATPVCDFCLAPNPAWEYPAAPVHIVGHPEITDSDDEWAACEVCHALIAGSRVGQLVERMVHQQRRNAPEGSIQDGAVLHYPSMAMSRRTCRHNVLSFFDARTGPPRPWTAP